MADSYICNKKGGLSASKDEAMITFSNSEIGKSQRELSVARFDFGCTVDKLGRVWIGGGKDETHVFDTVDVIDTLGSRVTYRLSQARSSLSALTDGLGNVWFAGGVTTTHGIRPIVYSDVVDRFNEKGERTTFKLSVARASIGAVTDKVGNVWFAGGAAASGTAVKTIDVFNPSGVRKTYGLISPLSACGAAVDGTGQLWFGGGITVIADNTTAMTGGITRINPDGTGAEFFAMTPTSPVSGATDDSGNVWFVGAYGGCVTKFTPEGVKTGLSLPSPSPWRSININKKSDGKLVVVGCEESNIITTINPVDNTMETTPRKNPLTQSGVCIDNNDRLWILGGAKIDPSVTDVSSVIDVHIFDNIQQHTLTRGRAFMGATTDKQGNVWFGGGVTVISNILYYEPYVDKFAPDGTQTRYTLSVGRRFVAATTDGDGNVWFGGGTTTGGSHSNVIDRFTPDGTRTSYTGGDSYGESAAATDKLGNVWITNGLTVDKFTPSGTKTVYTLSEKRAGIAAATDGNGNIWFAGGVYSIYKNIIDVFAPDGTKRRMALSINTSRLAAATDGDGNVWFGGGTTTGGSRSNVIDRFTPQGDRTSFELSSAREGVTATTDKLGNVWFIGGKIGVNSSNVIDIFTPAGVRTSTTLPVALAFASATTDGEGNIWVAGGTSATNTYSPIAYKITVGGSLPDSYKFTTILTKDSAYSLNGETGTCTANEFKDFVSDKPFNGYIKMKKGTFGNE